MGVRPPQGNDDEPDAIAFGIAELDAYLDDARLSFPATAEEVVTALSDPDVSYDPSGNTVSLSTAIEETGRERFESEQELLDVLHPVFEDKRTSSASGVVEWLQSVFSG